MATERQRGYYRGVLLPAIAEACGVPQGDQRKVAGGLHDDLGVIFGYDSFSELPDELAQWLLSYIHVLFAREFAVVLPMKGEPSFGPLNRMGMTTFLNIQKQIYAESLKDDTDAE